MYLACISSNSTRLNLPPFKAKAIAPKKAKYILFIPTSTGEIFCVKVTSTFFNQLLSYIIFSLMNIDDFTLGGWPTSLDKHCG